MDSADLTKKQRQLLEVFDQAKRPMTAHEAWGAVGMDNMGQATVYRAIAKLETLGLLEPVGIHGAAPMWESGSLAHHHHFFCSSCKNVFELQGCPQNLKSILPEGFSMKSHTITIYGQCDSCEDSDDRLNADV